MRYRERGSLAGVITSPVVGYPLSCANRTEYAYGTNTLLSPLLGHRVQMTDVVTPKWWLKKKLGQFVFNDLTIVDTLQEIRGTSSYTITNVANSCSPPLKAYYRREGHAFCYIYAQTYSFPELSLSSEKEMRALRDEVWTKVLAKRGEGNANFTESVAEIDQAFAMVRNPLENVQKFVRQFRRTGKRAPGYARVAADGWNTIQFLSSEWLRFRYGINPLVSDAKAAMKALRSQYDKEPMVHKSRASGAIASGNSSTGTVDWSPIRIYFTTGASSSYIARGFWIDKYRYDQFDELGLTFKNLVGLPLELTRLSFVADWFGNFSDLLYANVPRGDMLPFGGMLTTVDTRTHVYSPTSYVNINPGVWTIAGSVGDSFFKSEKVTLRRNYTAEGASFTFRNNFRLDEYVRATDAATIVAKLLNSITFGRDRLPKNFY